MKVKELIKQLQSIDGEIEVYLLENEDGYGQLRCVNDQVVLIHNTYNIDIYPRNWSVEEAGFDEDEWEMMKYDETKFCVVLSP